MTSIDHYAHTYDIPAIDSYGNNITMRLSCIGPAIVTMEFLTANSARLAEYHVSITNTGSLLTAMSACDRSARMWPGYSETVATQQETPSARGDGDAV
ncbi:hypothetical protein [Lentzea albidocapillata]|uniref:Uncharacterized protein n=1 Tax=Lentzea albidocapillata TaxID=40571 RepID=A0A1W2CYC7_9PSEU|nr:hypothetical protein [Lentzea albidocapillata]SMC90211.1 hypothetical protein SAMN05660733_02521 [Lentzea albidocapillata]